MQQTEKYQLNLIEMSDTFSPVPLNENAQKLEAALESVRAEAAAEAQTRAAETAAGAAALVAEAQARAAADSAEAQTRQAADNTEAQARAAAVSAEAQTRAAETAALAQRVTALEAHKIAIGAYQGECDAVTYNVWKSFSLDFTPVAVMVQVKTSFSMAMATWSTPHSVLEIFENGFRVKNQAGLYLNDKRYEYIFMALV